ncbi:ATP-dependent nuclease [Rouxiella badensis]|uniref:ATP-dependent nuclease n=1 Tax=Rouxiella badensis TaxID=1646377 RepID=UPI001788136C|nr:AAA family ATPase [Rouxiella badensis]QOI56220.1 AAA family ATPase [Rouxiella badensis subsp. acadiensis]
MRIESLKLKGFRNYSDALINFAQNTLVIGSNDIGKTNMIYSLRVLLDKSLSELDIEPNEMDFHIGTDGNQAEELEITVAFIEVNEDAIVSLLKGHVSDGGETIIKYRAKRNDLSYEISIGQSPDEMESINGRFYLKHLNMKYVNSQRDLERFIQKEKKYLLKISNENLSDPERDSDKNKVERISRLLNVVNKRVGQLNYVSAATKNVNHELGLLAHHNSGYSVQLGAGAIQVNSFIDKLDLGASTNGGEVMLGGDGRNNQILLALWKAKSIQEHDLENEVVIYCVEEPEAHLHPHQQRKLADYLYKKLPGQSIISTHSPQITSQYKPDSIIRLLMKDGATSAASNGCSDCISSAWGSMGYRMSILPAEAFFSNAVLLVEGPSEKMFYTELAKEFGIDLDYLNISVLSVDGVQFEVYKKILNALEIPLVVRTDNDVSKKTVKRLECSYFSGVNRCYKLIGEPPLVHGPAGLSPSDTLSNGIWSGASEKINQHGIFLSKIDLENDLAAEVPDLICGFADVGNNLTAAIKYLQDKKAIRMREFLEYSKGQLDRLKHGELIKPILFIENLVTGA